MSIMIKLTKNKPENAVNMLPSTLANVLERQLLSPKSWFDTTIKAMPKAKKIRYIIIPII